MQALSAPKDIADLLAALALLTGSSCWSLNEMVVNGSGFA